MPSLLPTVGPSPSPSHWPTYTPSSPPSRYPTAMPSSAPSQSPTISLIQFCATRIPQCDASKFDCSTSYTIGIRQEISGVAVSTFDAHAFLCAVAASANLSTDSLSLINVAPPTLRFHLSNTVVEAAYSINVALGAYGYSDSLVAYDSITRALNSSVVNGDFTSLLHSIGSYSNDAFGASGVQATSISYDAYTTPLTARPTSQSGGSVTSLSLSGILSLSRSNFWYIIFSVVAVSGFIIFASISWYFYRRYRLAQRSDKLNRLQRIDNQEDMDSEQGDVRWSSDYEEGLLRGSNLRKHHEEVMILI